MDEYKMNVNYTLNCSNSSDRNQDEGDSPGFQLDKDLGLTLMAIATIATNGSVLYLMKTKRSLRTVTNNFLASLSISDALTGLYAIPLYLACKATYRNDLCEASVPIFTFTCISTLSHIAVVTLDRYIFIMYSLRYTTIVTKYRSRVVIVFIWLWSILVALIQLVWATPGEVNVNKDGSEEFDKHEKAFSLALLLIVLLPFPLLVFAYYQIFVQVRQQNRFIRNHIAPGAERPKSHELRTVAAFVLMLAAYLFCWMPNAIIRFQYSTSSFELPRWAEEIIVHLRFLTSMINPLLYVFGKQDFRNSVEFCRHRQVHHGSRGESSTVPRSGQTATVVSELQVSVNLAISDSQMP